MIKRYEKFVSEKLFIPGDINENLLETISDPNFSIVVPGKCNGACSFCFWNESKACGDYVKNLTETLNNLPTQFHQLSLTGGEPTLSPYLSDILESIDTERWTHTVLTTNGTNLKKFIPQLEGKINHINISRHHYNDEINESVFESSTVPSGEFLKQLVSELNEVGIDVTYSAVLTEHLNDKEEVKNFIKFAKSHGVDKIFLRKEHGTLDPSEAEQAFEHISAEEFTCPVCRTSVQEINETVVEWKTSLEEPSKELGMIYELVYNQNGVLTSDWEQELIVESNNIKADTNAIFESCGSGSSYGGCKSIGKSYDSEPTYMEQLEAERKRKLKLKGKKVKKVVANIKKQIEDKTKVEKIEDEVQPVKKSASNVSTTFADFDVNYEIKKKK